MSYTVTEKGTVTIPVEIRRKLHLKKGSKVRFLETDKGALLVPAPTFEELRGAIPREVAYEIIRELQQERRREAKSED